MRLTTKGRFAVTAMLDMALQEQAGPVTLAAISERQKISLAYLEQLFGKLRRRDLVVSIRGPGGGYCLARPAQAISVADIVVAVDEPLDATQCGGKENCMSETTPCMTHNLWVSLNNTIFQYLASITLQTLMTQQQEKTIQIVHDQRNYYGQQKSASFIKAY
jgi:Rrf2 family iron-sulfur cluster assembly transcriptional regulator